MLIVLTSIKGAPGVTTAARALAAAWPSEQSPVLMELDTSGGDLIADFGLDAEPGLMSLAAAARRERRSHLVREHVQELPGGLLVVAAPPGAEQAAAAIDVLMSSAPWQAAMDQPGRGTGSSPADPMALIVDAGRLPARAAPGGDVARMLRAADAVLLVARNDSRGLVHAAARRGQLEALVGSRMRIRLLLIDAGEYPADEVARDLGIPVAGVLPVDGRAARALSGRAVRRPAALRRSPLLRAAGDVARRLTVPARRPGPSPDPTVELPPSEPTVPEGAAAHGVEEAR